VLRALGLSEARILSSLRFGLGRFTTEEEVGYVAERTIRAVKQLREKSVEYQMKKEGMDLNAAG